MHIDFQYLDDNGYKVNYLNSDNEFYNKADFYKHKMYYLEMKHGTSENF